MFNGFECCKAEGNNSSGKSWKQIGLTKRLIAFVPTEVDCDAVVAGYGPP
jgi:hypothetical protein